MKRDNRQCPSCDQAEMAFAERDIPFEYKGERLVVLKVAGWVCTLCGEGVFADGEGKRYADALDNFVNDVDKAQREDLRRIRRKLHLSQREAAGLFGGGTNAFSEYERGVTKPSKSTLLLMKLLEKHPDLMDEVRQQVC
jgi:HTH-type transcriptional regulator/antitoxin MqsA